jgi:RNA polymerase sigma-70 factor (ECF subfamily)
MLRVVTRSQRAAAPVLAAALSPADEAELIARCRRGERAAHDEFYQRFCRLVASNLSRVLGDQRDLEDLVQEVFVIAYRGLDRFRGEARLSTWLYRICANVAMGKIRSRVRKPPPLPLADDSVVEVSVHAARPETPMQSLQRAEARQRVYRALDQLPPKKRLVLYLHEIEGLDLKDIAYIVSANAITVRTRLFYARKEFYRVLTADGQEGV